MSRWVVQAFGTRRERGAAATEYALLALLIAAVIIGVLVALGPDVRSLYEEVDW